ncbi:MAG TPA: hypothetical protein VHE34_02305 [Puia sp.]|uniref:hypothetical protein n=1 Tax=Puia sp. TaxID=2045100 RepID=UPI002C80A6D8|nr:hypothetical protein [Puia sp.]HVU94019.1 hypothetical protein [Puia sp.]
MNKYYAVLTLLCLLDHTYRRPTAAPTIGFFLDSWTEKKFILPATLVNPRATPLTIRLDIHHFHPGKNVYWYTLAGAAAGEADTTEFPRKVFVNNKSTTVPARGAVFLVVEK